METVQLKQFDITIYLIICLINKNMKIYRFLIIALLISLTSAYSIAQNPLIIDNFAPYVKKVEIFSGAGAGAVLIYDEDWSWDATPGLEKLVFLPKNCIAQAVNQEVEIIIYTSEAMKANSVKVSIDDVQPNQITAVMDGTPLKWKVTIPTASITPFYTAGSISIFPINIIGKDLNNNDIQGFSEDDTERGVANIKKRVSPAQFAPNTPDIPDSRHFLKIGDAPNGGNGCMSANFSSDLVNIDDGGNITFSDNSEGIITQYEWIFEGGTPAKILGKGPHNVKYNSPGTYDVTLQVTDGTITHSKKVLDLISVREREVYNLALNFTYDNGRNMLVGTSSKPPQFWTWQIKTIAGTVPKDGQEVPHTVSFLDNDQEVTLTVSFLDGSQKSITKKINHLGFVY